MKTLALEENKAAHEASPEAKVNRKRPKLRWNSIGVKLFLSYLAIVAVVVLVLLQTADFVVPANFAAQRGRMLRAGLGATGNGAGFGYGYGMGREGGSGYGAANAEALLSQAFDQSLSQGLLVAGGLALLVAIAISLFITWRIVGPVQRLVKASRRIAAGHYSERVPVEKLQLPAKLARASHQDEIGELATSFNEMAQALEATERRRLELVGDVAHELRTPVATLQGYLEGLLDGVIQPDERTWAKLSDEANRLRRLIDDLQELSRAEAHQVPLKLAPVNPLELVRVATDRLSSQFQEKGLTFTSDLPPELPPVEADFERAVQVLTNLLTNALRYSPAPGMVKLMVRSASSEVEFSVSDTGAGISPEHLPHLFERFYRVDKSRSRVLGGSGIGLTISQALVEAMGGHIEVTSPGPGKGSTFSFTLPRAD